MLKRTIVSTAALAGFVFLAFGSAGGSSDVNFDDFEDLSAGNSGNKDACQNYVDKVNGLACTPNDMMDRDQTCPDALNMSPLDMSSYYNCMADAAKCNGDIPDLSGATDCEMPTL